MTEQLDPAAVKEQLDAMRSEMERVASAVMSLLGKQQQATEQRVKSLEQRLLLRQERPTVVRIASVLTAMDRIRDDAEARAHAHEALLDILFNLGYTQFGAVGEPYDVARHDALAGEADGQPVISEVHTLGLEAFDDVVMRARVSVGDRPNETSEQESA